MKNFTLTLHIISMCLVVGTLFLQSLIVVFRLRLKKQEEVAGVKNVQKRIHKFIYYPILGVTIISGAILANTIDVFSQVQNNWMSLKLGLLIILIVFGILYAESYLRKGFHGLIHVRCMSEEGMHLFLIFKFTHFLQIIFYSDTSV